MLYIKDSVNYIVYLYIIRLYSGLFKQNISIIVIKSLLQYFDNHGLLVNPFSFAIFLNNICVNIVFFSLLSHTILQILLIFLIKFLYFVFLMILF
jgi:hypothetical protein